MTSVAERIRPKAPAKLAAGFDHLELWVGNARAFAHFLMAAFGFGCIAYAGPESGSDRASYVLRQGNVVLVVTAGLDPDDEVCSHVRLHGDGVRAVAVATTDVDGALRSAVAGGAQVVEPSSRHADTHGVLRRAAIAAYGDTAHEFVDRSDYSGVFSPGFTDERLPLLEQAGSPGLETIDHVVANVGEGLLDQWVDWHANVLGLREMRRFDAEQVSTEHSALRSTVMWNGGGVVLPINEPAPGLRKSQITEYLEAYRGPGVQHVALRTGDIVRAVDELTRRGVRFLVPPDTYYEDARRRCEGLEVAWQDVERLGILVDADSSGLLLQVFTQTVSDRPTLFVEVIERRGSTGFGEGNFKALFEAIEREQARRGNL